MVKKSENTSTVSQIENVIYQELKKYGFRKHGRTLCRFTGPEDDIAQIITFQLGQAYRDETHLLYVNTGIRVPECFERDFVNAIEKKPYYYDYHATIRSMLGKIDGKKTYREFNLQTEKTIDVEAEILRDIIDKVLPVYDLLSSREDILANRKKFPNFDTLNNHLVTLEEAFIYGHLGNIEKANQVFAEYYTDIVGKRDTAENKYEYMRYEGHRKSIEETARINGLRIPSQQIN